MASQSILDQAAEVREKARRVKELCDEMRKAGKPWVSSEIASEDAQEIARAGLRQAWTMLDRIQQILMEVRDHKTTPSAPKGEQADG